MENVKLVNNDNVDFKEYSSGKRIKVSESKLKVLVDKFLTNMDKSAEKFVEVSNVETTAQEVKVQKPTISSIDKEKQIDDFFFNSSLEKQKPSMEVRKPYEMNRENKPYSFERQIKEESNKIVRPKEYTVPDIKSPVNIGDRSEKIRKMSESADPKSVVGKVLINGVSKLDENKNEIAKIKKSIDNIESTITDLEKQKEVISGGKQDIEDILSKTATVSLTEIREAASLDSSQRAQRELNKIKESIDNLQRIKSEEEEKLRKLEENKLKLEQERAQQKTRLMSAEKNGIELCNTIERDLNTADQIEKLEKEKETLEKQLSITTAESPKKPVSVYNPFEKMRVMEEEVESVKRTH